MYIFKLNLIKNLKFQMTRIEKTFKNIKTNLLIITKFIIIFLLFRKINYNLFLLFKKI